MSGTYLPLQSIVIIIVLFFTIVAEVIYLSTLEDVIYIWNSLVFPSPLLNNPHNTFRGTRQRPSIPSLLYRQDAIDNYYSRPHIYGRSVPIIVGGSDGSGTRAFVQILQELGVTMVVEDKGTMDVHAWQLYSGEGWPGLVSRVLNVTHSAIYNLDEIPDNIDAIAYAGLGSLLSSMEVAADVLKTTNTGDTPTSDISFGFKAPVSMLLLPFFQRQLPSFKFIHIVRDGRDVAFSENHSPVDKFYNVYKSNPDQEERALLDQDFGFDARSRIKAMQLWNAWNKEVYEYGRTHADGKTFDVLVMRSEDLLDNKYESLLKLADFVGSSRTPHELCCMSRKQAKDIGVSHGDADGPHIFEAADFEAIRGRFHGFDKGAGNAPDVREWPDTANWEDMRGKMLGQQRPLGHWQRRRLEESEEIHPLALHSGNVGFPHAVIPKFRPRDNIRNSKETDFNQLNHFYNRHSNLAKGGFTKPKEVRDRYGKWMQKLEGKPDLSRKLHEEGRDALRIFGYEPERIFMDIKQSSNPCDDNVICPDM
jgi:hypothetical protein